MSSSLLTNNDASQDDRDSRPLPPVGVNNDASKHWQQWSEARPSVITVIPDLCQDAAKPSLGKPMDFLQHLDFLCGGHPLVNFMNVVSRTWSGAVVACLIRVNGEKGGRRQDPVGQVYHGKCWLMQFEFLREFLNLFGYRRRALRLGRGNFFFENVRKRRNQTRVKTPEFDVKRSDFDIFICLKINNTRWKDP